MAVLVDHTIRSVILDMEFQQLLLVPTRWPLPSNLQRPILTILPDQLQ